MIKPLKYLLGILIMLQCVDCAPSALVFENAGLWLPPDFDPKKEVLTVIVGPASRRQADVMKGYMYNKYPYKYTFKKPELNDQAIDADGIQHRFELRCFENVNIPEANDKRRLPPNGSLDFYFYDRLKDKKYHQTDRASANGTPTFMGVINTILDKATRQ